jgi:beta-N-acetylhexosaminidase
MIISEVSRLNERKKRAIARLIVGFHGLEPSPDLVKVVGDYSPAGVILFARNIEEKRQVQECNRALRNLWSSGESPWISLDQEGGRVRRIKEISWPTMRHLGVLNDIELTKELIRALNSEVREWGFNGNWAPCADVDSNPDNPVIGDRSFSRDPHECAEYVIAAMEAMRARRPA